MLLIREEEVRRYDGNRRWRTRGWITEDRRLLGVAERRLFEHRADWLALLPQELRVFTAKDLAQSMAISVGLAQKMAYCLRKVGAADFIGRRRRANVYTTSGA